MKRSKYLVTSLTLAVVLMWLLCLRGSAETSAAMAETRQVVLLPPTGADPTDQEILRWQQRIAARTSDSAGWERLGWAYVAKARRTQDAGFYKLAELTSDAWESACGPNSDARLLRGHVDHNLHRFSAAEEIARGLVAERTSPVDFALLSDALMEQGKLNEAVEACQKLANLCPGVEATSRIAHLRWVFGDLNGAIDAMHAAVRMTDPRDEETRAWLYSRLAGYELLDGEILRSVTYSETALSAVPDYPLALAIKGRALYAVGQYEAALPMLRRAAELNPVPDNLWWLADALRARGQLTAATEVETKLRRFGEADPRTLSLFLATQGDELERAVRLATEELKSRSDLFTHDALAFALVRLGKLQKAAAEMALAMAHQTSDPRLFLHAGMIAEKTGNAPEANRLYRRAKTMAGALTPSEQLILSDRLESTAGLTANP